ncbi:levanase [Sporolactobacillus inulinus]|uniref:Levanase n=1 Tax=Sporolactobacillus inulinus TaxID=2078 RepID=A0A4Y1ZIK2_9BACL|nr:levanase [Sporolactobacillus inulinus]
MKDWRYTSGFTPENIGLIECPDLFQLRAANGTVKWVLGASANGRASGQPNTYAYWIGNFDGEQFTPDQPAPQWLDYGFDWYAAVTFENENPKRRLDSRYAIAWMNNWDYPNTTPTLDEDFNGVNSIVRTIHLAKHGQQYSLISKPISALNKQATATQQPRTIHVNGNKALGASGTAYQIDTDISWTDARNIGLRLRESSNKKRHIDVGILTEDHALYVNRRFTNQPDDKNRVSKAAHPFRRQQRKSI